MQDWNKEWDLWFDHYQQDKRHAYYINAVLEDGVDSILEIAAGSFRDTNTLNMLGRNCHGIDFSQSAVSKAKELLGYDPDYDFARGLYEAIEWYKQLVMK